MILRKVFPILILCSCQFTLTAAQENFPNLLPLVLPSAAAHAQDFNKTVVPITELKLLGTGVETKFGTGFCLDPECRFIGTNYHVAMMGQPRKIKGQKVVQRFLATGPDDDGATVNDGPSMSPRKYTLCRDLAIFELRHAVPHYRGVGFSLDDLQVGQEVEIYAYPLEGINPIRSLLQFHGTFKGQTTTGLLAFDYGLFAGKAIRSGASGGIVVDGKSKKIVGILNEIERNGKTIALAVPVQSLVEFVSKVQPFLAHTLFPSIKGISPLSADLYPKFQPPSPTGVVEHRPIEPAEVEVLRSKAQTLADSMRNFIAVQTFAWGSGDKAPVAESAMEVRVLNGFQRFREYPDGKKELDEVPLPRINTAMGTGGEWAELPQMVGTELQLKIQQAPDAVVNGRRIRVFQFRAEIEDGLCRFDTQRDFIFFTTSKISSHSCYGEVWTDEDFNILRMSEHLEQAGEWEKYQSVVTFGWLKLADETRRLIPLTIYAQAEHHKKIYWCRGQFRDYRVFSSSAKMIARRD